LPEPRHVWQVPVPRHSAHFLEAPGESPLTLSETTLGVGKLEWREPVPLHLEHLPLPWQLAQTAVSVFMAISFLYRNGSGQLPFLSLGLYLLFIM
jgi:hypothetical protein